MSMGRGTRRPVVLDRNASRAVDRRAIDEYGIPGIVLMENAARGAFDEAVSMLGAASIDAPPWAVIACGRGNNGGDGYALARQLDEAGVRVDILSLGDCRAGSDAAVNASICGRMNLPTHAVDPDDLDPIRTRIEQADLVVDALFGTGLDRPLSGTAAALVAAMNEHAQGILAVDVPSGLDCDTGRPVGDGPCVRATRTVTFVALKPGLTRPESIPYAGHVVVAPIGIPAALLRSIAG